MSATYTIHELAARFDLSPRTIHKYRVLGVLPPPAGRGRSTRWSDEHVDALDYLQKTRDGYLTIAEIAERRAERERDDTYSETVNTWNAATRSEKTHRAAICRDLGHDLIPTPFGSTVCRRCLFYPVERG